VAHNSPCDFGRHRILVRQLLANPFPEMVALGREEAKPLDLQYTAVDGRVIDLTEMRGKVVLVDFWASWCSYCINEVPSVVAAYNQYHPRGLEIVGISWDDHLNWMLDFMNSQGMRWPQYFYPDHTGNSISRRYNVGTLPTLWLIDKHGCLVNVTCGRDLPAQVERVLAEE
jgi:thiol-disulfide isomerase/thioredoxin